MLPTLDLLLLLYYQWTFFVTSLMQVHVGMGLTPLSLSLNNN